MNKKIFKFIIALVIILIIDLSVVIIDFLKLININFEGNGYAYIKYLILVICAIYIEIIIHELGHFFAGVFMKFMFDEFIIFPFSFKIYDKKLKIRLTYNEGSLGSCIMYPNQFRDINSKMLIYYFSGIIGDFVLFLISSIGFNYCINKDYASLFKAFIILLCIISEINFIKNLISAKINEKKTDGKQVIDILMELPKTEMEMIEIYIYSRLIKGISPGKIDFKLADNYKGDLFIDMYLYYHYLEKNNIDEVRKCIKLLEKYSDNIAVLNEVLYFYCTIDNNMNKCKEIYKKIEDGLNVYDNICDCRIKMAYEMYVTKNIEASIKIGKKGLELEKEYSIRGMAAFEANQIKRILVEAEKRIEED